MSAYVLTKTYVQVLNALNSKQVSQTAPRFDGLITCF